MQNQQSMKLSTGEKAINPIVIIGILFFIFGFVTWLNGTLIPFLKLACHLQSDAQAFLVTFAFYIAYFFLAMPSSAILKKVGMKKGMALGLAVMAVGSLLFVPAAYSRNFALFLAGLFVQGAGLSLLQTASNPYISIIGPIESAAKRISIMGVCNKVAGILSPLILGIIILKDASVLEAGIGAATNQSARELLLDELAQRVVVPYLVMTGVLVLLSLWIGRSGLPDIDVTVANAEARDETKSKEKSILQYPHLLLGCLCLFLYVGVEVMAGDAIGVYGKSFGIPLDQAKYFTSITLFSMLLGYFIGIVAIPRFITQEKSLKLSAVLGVAFSVAALLTKGYVSVGFVAALGLANALMWPAIFPMAIRGLGKFTERGSAMLIMGIAGGALIPLLYGALKGKYDFQWVFFVIVCPCYLYIFYYSVKGHKAKHLQKENSNTISPVDQRAQS
jgi:glucose/galactose transporter